MDLKQFLTVAVVVAPILCLLLGGAFIAAGSGVERLSSTRDYVQVAGNFSAMLLRVAGYVVVLLLVQHFIGLRSTFGW
ncbi:hypothetical protein [Paludisphaera rhizosphaerae]|uniref:hypothetical protein n=1 Tax=Paludisphaera rhizosphaerae TaxID=2711216 RepID=UPI0013EA4BE8|nr:hypothetical protein [Paludisphaera rhizosphaerae]